MNEKIPKVKSYMVYSTPLPNAPAAHLYIPSPLVPEQVQFLRRYIDLLLETVTDEPEPTTESLESEGDV